MLKKLIAIILITVSFLLLTSCNDRIPGKEVSDAKDNRFQRIEDYTFSFGGGSCSIIEDTVTGALYLSPGSHGGVSPWYKDTSGTIMTRKDLEEQSK